MVPDTTLRLKTALKALEDIVTPAIPSEAGFANEQLALIKESIQIVIDQIPLEYSFIIKDSLDHINFSYEITKITELSDKISKKIRNSRNDLENCMGLDRPDLRFLSEKLRTLKQALEDAVNHLCEVASGDNLKKIQLLILNHSAARITLERAWTVATGFESDPSDIPAVSDLISGTCEEPDAV